MNDQQSIERQAILKSLWESGMAPNFQDRPQETKNWIKDMFEFSMELLYNVPKADKPPVVTGNPTWPHPGEEKPYLPSTVKGIPMPGKRITEAQSKRFFAIAKSKGLPTPAISQWLKENGVTSGRSEDIPPEKYNQFCGAFEAAQ